MHKILNVHLKIPKYFCGVTLPTPPHDLDGVLTGVAIPHTSRVQKWGTSHHRVISPGRRRARKSEPDRRPDPGPRTGSIHPGRPGTGPTPGDPKIGRTGRFRRPRRTAGLVRGIPDRRPGRPRDPETDGRPETDGAAGSAGTTDPPRDPPTGPRDRTHPGRPDRVDSRETGPTHRTGRPDPFHALRSRSYLREDLRPKKG